MEIDSSDKFTFVLIPSNDLNEPIEIIKSKKGGLENDELQIYAKNHFNNEFEGHLRLQTIKQNMLTLGKDISTIDPNLKSAIYEMSATLDIITLQLPNQRNNYIGVSIYCDSNGIAKEYKPNTRATRIAHSCGHKNIIIYGDSFISRYYDNEQYPWERLDLTLNDININSDWIKICEKDNAGKDLSSYTSAGSFSKAMSSVVGYCPSVDELTLADKPIPKPIEEELTNLSWNQTNEEIEIHLHINKETSAKQVVVTIKPNYLSIYLPHYATDSLPSYLNSPTKLENDLINSNGIELFGKVIVGDSSWSIIGKDENRELVVTLYKANQLQWASLNK